MGIFRKFCLDTTWHGFSHLIASSTNCGKIGWWFVIIFGLFCFSQQMWQMIGGLIDIDDHYTTSVKHIYKRGLPYPTITICNYNRIRKSKAEEYEFDEELRKYFLSRTAVGGNLIEDENVTHLKDKYTIWRHKYNFTYEKIVHTMGHNCQDTIVMLKNLLFNLPEDLCKSKMDSGMTIKPIITMDYGLCHQINISQQLQVIGTGSFFSLKLLLNADTSNYIDDAMNNNNDEGLAIQISFNGKVKSGLWLAIMPGRHSWIGMRTMRKHMKTVSQESYNIVIPPPCKRKPTMPVSFDEDFDISNCFANCVAAKPAYLCNCSPTILGKNLTFCELEQMEDCILPYVKNASITGQLGNDTAECILQYCDYPACEEISIQSTLETSKFPTKNQLSKLKEQMKKKGLVTEESSEKFRNDLALVDIYYTTMAIEEVELYERVTLDQLVANLGGQLGLWMGVSYITILHLIVTCCTACCCCCTCGKRNNKSHENIEPKEYPDKQPPNKESSI